MLYAGYGGTGPMIEHPGSWREEQCQGFEAPSVPAFLAWAAQGVPGQSRLHTETALLSGRCGTVLTPFLRQVPFLPHSATFPVHSSADLYHMTNGTMKEF